MLNNRMFKIVRPFPISLKIFKRIESKGFREFLVEPTYGDVIMYTSLDEINFEKCIELLRSCFKINVLAAMSIIYYQYYKEYCDYVCNSNFNDLLKIRRRSYKILLRWKKLLEVSDDLLYPQNKYLRIIIEILNIWLSLAKKEPIKI